MLLPHFTALGAGPIVLFLHGAGGGFRSFAPQVEQFAGAGFRAVAWDMPGYGSSTPVEPYGVRGLAQSCVALIEALLPDEAADPQRSVAQVSPVTYRLALQAQASFDRDAALSHIHVPTLLLTCLLYTSPSPRDYAASRMPSSA